MKEVQLYTDGACSGNPGPGGWGAILVYGVFEKTNSGYVPHSTNNRMELTAVIEGLKMLKEPCSLSIYADSAYVVNPFQKKWIYGWIVRGWRKTDNKKVENEDLWQELYELISKHKYKFVKVEGHSGHYYNDRCDKLATQAIKQYRAS